MNEVNTNEHGKAVAALVLGIISCVSVFTGIGAIVGVVLGIVGIVLAKKAKDEGNTEGICKAGMILSIIGLCLSGICFIMTVGVLGALGLAGATL